jgi:hypothetical protein
VPAGQRPPCQAGAGRKTDVSDAAWLCRLAGAGLLKASFVPPKPIRQLRNLTRYRTTQIQERAREVNRLHKALEDARIKLDCVAADVMGKSGRDMLDALVAGVLSDEVCVVVVTESAVVAGKDTSDHQDHL